MEPYSSLRSPPSNKLLSSCLLLSLFRPYLIPPIGTKRRTCYYYSYLYTIHCNHHSVSPSSLASSYLTTVPQPNSISSVTLETATLIFSIHFILQQSPLSTRPKKEIKTQCWALLIMLYYAGVFTKVIVAKVIVDFFWQRKVKSIINYMPSVFWIPFLPQCSRPSCKTLLIHYFL